MVKIKICGITNLEDALFAAECGADALGFVQYKKSPRYIEKKRAKEIIEKLPPFIKTVGVFVNSDLNVILETASNCSFDLVQLHGDEDLKFCKEIKKKIRLIKAFRIKNRDSIKDISKFSSLVNTFLIDTHLEGKYGGTGICFDWSIVREAKKYGNIILAGGLNRENISLVLRNIKPYGVDVSSGVEISPGVKDKKKVEAFIKTIKEMER
ncbi:MAG TPA: phosphoribosylanthranilate isomerase [Nitrospinota bacterium]|nr:phosphoribosylanthranilate isomerase [Nitrospinota bacterium]